MILELLVGLLLLLSGGLSFAAALGVWRLPDFFLRLHAPALAYTLGSWAVTLASILHFTAGARELSLHVWLVIILLSITAPITTMLLARAALFRQRRAGDDLPRPLSGPAAQVAEAQAAGAEASADSGAGDRT